MVKELMESLLEELGHVLKIGDLHVDSNHSCLINFPQGLKIQIEMDSQGQSVLLGTDLGAVSPGKWRENLFREALKTNGQNGPRHGTLAYSQKTEHLILFEYLPTKDLTGEKIADALSPFTEKALLWKNGLEKGEIPALTSVHTSSRMFGL